MPRFGGDGTDHVLFGEGGAGGGADLFGVGERGGGVGDLGGGGGDHGGGGGGVGVAAACVGGDRLAYNRSIESSIVTARNTMMRRGMNWT